MFSFMDSWSTEVDIRHTGAQGRVRTCLISKLKLWSRRSEEKGFFVIIGRSGETVWDRLAGMFTVLIDKTLLSCQRVGECKFT
jgi:hypothetical protein